VSDSLPWLFIFVVGHLHKLFFLFSKLQLQPTTYMKIVLTA